MSAGVSMRTLTVAASLLAAALAAVALVVSAAMASANAEGGASTSAHGANATSTPPTVEPPPTVGPNPTSTPPTIEPPPTVEPPVPTPTPGTPTASRLTLGVQTAAVISGFGDRDRFRLNITRADLEPGAATVRVRISTTGWVELRGHLLDVAIGRLVEAEQGNLVTAPLTQRTYHLGSMIMHLKPGSYQLDIWSLWWGGPYNYTVTAENLDAPPTPTSTPTPPPPPTVEPPSTTTPPTVAGPGGGSGRGGGGGGGRRGGGGPRASVDEDAPGDDSPPTATEPEPDAPEQPQVVTPHSDDVQVVTRTAEDADAPKGFRLLDSVFDITAPSASADDPLELRFEVETDESPDAIAVFRNGEQVPDCVGNTGRADPDPCVASRTADDGSVVIVALTSRASVWAFGAGETESGEASRRVTPLWAALAVAIAAVGLFLVRVRRGGGVAG